LLAQPDLVGQRHRTAQHVFDSQIAERRARAATVGSGNWL
jgi:hypothetical protein